MAETIFAGENIEKLALKNTFTVFAFSRVISRGSLKNSSCVTVHATDATTIDKIISQKICSGIGINKKVHQPKSATEPENTQFARTIFITVKAKFIIF